MEPKTVGALLELGERVLTDSSHLFDDHDHGREAEDLLVAVLDSDIEDFDDDFEVSKRLRERYLSLVARRAGGEPLPLLVGHIVFNGLELKVKPGTFMPRPSSELTVARAAKRLRGRKRPVVVDLATGTGPIALAVADEFPAAEVWGADIDDAMLELGRHNARALGISNVKLRRSDLYGGLPKRLAGSVDVITGHIPYVPRDEIDDLPAEVREFEPLSSLTDLSDDGLGLLRRAIADAPRWLKRGGWLLLEVSHDLESKVRRLCRTAGLEDRGVGRDSDDLSLVVEAHKTRT
jgi:release factor glutamine methyltransferase